VAVAQVTFDGVINSGAGEEWENAEGAAIQNNFTEFGNQLLTPGDFPGSEADELFVTTDGTDLYIGVTGNLEQNGNAMIILLDTQAGGQNVLETQIAPVTSELPCSFNGPPNAVQGLGRPLLRDDNMTPDDTTDDVTSVDSMTSGTTLDAGFLVDYAISCDTAGGVLSVSQYTLYDTDQGDWDDPSTGVPDCGGTPPDPTIEELDYFATRLFRGRVAVNSGDSFLTDGVGSWEAAFDNTGRDGVTGFTGNPPDAPGSTGVKGDPRSQTTGLEMRIPLADIGATLSPDLDIKMMVLITSSDGTIVSNQILPGISAGANADNLGARPDFSAITGSFATVTQAAANFTAPGGSLDGTDIVTDFGLANLIASQDSVTSFGDRDCLSPRGGSELDQLFLKHDGDFLYIGVTGNLEGNNNAMIVLLDTIAGGMDVELDTEIAPETSGVCTFNGPPSAVQGLGQALVTDDGGSPADPADDVTSRDPVNTDKTIIDTGFAPDFALAIDHNGTDLFMTQYNLFGSSQGTWDDPSTGPDDCSAAANPPSNEALDYFATRVFRGQSFVNSASSGPLAGTNPNSSEVAFDNTGYDLGVNGIGAAMVGDPTTQTKGLEAKIAWADLGLTAPITSDQQIKIQVIVTSSDGFVSNQSLPPVGFGLTNTTLGSRPSYAAIAGDQFATHDVVYDMSFAPTLDGQNITTEGFGTAVAVQDTATDFGDEGLDPVVDCDTDVQAGSEINELFVQDTGAAGGLEIGLTGNLEQNGNNLVIFIDSVAAAGENTLDGNDGRITGMATSILPNKPDANPMNADYAVVFNLFSGTAFVDLVNLNSDISTYIGSDEVDSGDGFLDNSGVVPGWRAIINNTNFDGVSGDSADDPQTSAAETAETGVELLVPFTEIGSPADQQEICVWAVIGNQDMGFLSNQILPALSGSGGIGNYGGPVDDFATLGYECMSIVVGEPSTCNDPVFDGDGDGDVDSDDWGLFQSCITDYAGSSGGSLAPECECFDWDGNLQIDPTDAVIFERCANGSTVPPVGASGPAIPADVSCDD
jgi:hypothetical protein